MKPVDAHPEIAQTIRTLRIIVGVLTLGVAGFLGYTIYVVHGPDAPLDLEGDGLLTWVMLGLGFMQTVAFVILRAKMLAKAREKYADDDIEGFCAAYQTASIVSAALVEGTGFFAAIVHMLTGGQIALGVGCVSVLVMLTLIPSEGRVNSMLDSVP